MLFAAYICAFLGSELALGALAFMLPRLLREPKPTAERHLPSPTLTVVEPEIKSTVFGNPRTDLTVADVAQGANPLRWLIDVSLPVEARYRGRSPKAQEGLHLGPA